MTVRKILADCARIAEGDALGDAIINGDALSGDDAYAAALLLKSFNATQRMVAYDFEPLRKKMAVSGGRADYSDLPYVPIEITGVYDERGKSLVFKAHATFVTFPDTAVSLEANCAAKDSAEDDDFEYENTRIASAFVYGVLAEYCLARGRYEESANYDSRFRAEAERSPLKTRKLRARKDWGL